MKIARSVKLLEVFSDIAYGTGSRGRSIQGMAIFFAGAIISWQTAVQPFVTHIRSTGILFEKIGLKAVIALAWQLFLEPFLGNLAWEPVLGNLAWESFLVTLACEPVPGKIDWKSGSWGG